MKNTLTSSICILGVGTFLLTLSVMPVSGGTIATPYVAGSHQGWNEASDPMTETFLGSGIWTRTYTGLTPGARHEWKVTDGTWGLSYPGPNSWLYADALGSVKITYDGNTYADGWSSSTDRLGLSTDPGTWNAVGDWQSQVGGANWDNANPNTLMTALGGGIYEFTATLAPGSYAWKGVVNGSWDSISWDNRSIGTANWNFTTDAINNTAIFRVDAINGVAQMVVTSVPEPTSLALCGLGALAMFSRIRRK
jgi:hypothetical protein